jgi:hypothetical protein
MFKGKAIQFLNTEWLFFIVETASHASRAGQAVLQIVLLP